MLLQAKNINLEANCEEASKKSKLKDILQRYWLYSPKPLISSETLSYPMAGPPKPFSEAFLYKRPVLAHASDLLQISQTNGIWPHLAPGLLLSGPKPSTSSSRPRCTAWLCLGTSRPSPSSRHLQIALWFTQDGPGHVTEKSNWERNLGNWVSTST